jgi:DNA-binding MarR family transcriptional regulator
MAAEYIEGVSRALPFLYAAEELANALSERLAPLFAAAGLTATQFNVLYMLIEEGPMQLSALAEQRRCVKSNVSYITRAMLREGLVELAASPDDQRARVISASALGRRRYAAAKAAAQKLEHTLRRALGAEATDQTARACLDAAAALDSLR